MQLLRHNSAREHAKSIKEAGEDRPWRARRRSQGSTAPAALTSLSVARCQAAELERGELALTEAARDKGAIWSQSRWCPWPAGHSPGLAGVFRDLETVRLRRFPGVPLRRSDFPAQAVQLGAARAGNGADLKPRAPHRRRREG